jgi:polyphenol oxidase
MIRLPGLDGVAFSEAIDGDQRSDRAARRALAAELGVSADWATVNQVHGGEVIRVEGPGQAGDADALWTSVEGLPLGVFTADCFGVVLLAPRAVGVAHVGWRGAYRGVVTALRRRMELAGFLPSKAAVGPGIGPCCFEVGPEVAKRFRSAGSTTSWGTRSVNLRAVLGEQLDGLAISSTESCTYHEATWFSHRRNGSPMRQAALGWFR